jgi:ribosomal protein S18 acetylase RimI-like enzyme
MTIQISSDREKLQIGEIQSMLSGTYWCPGITEIEIWKGIRNSALAVGAYLENGRQIGFLRVVSDKVRFAYLLDVVVADAYRRRGIAREMVRYTLSHPELKEVYQWLLATSDAHGVYRECGFRSLERPEKWMAILNTRPDRTDYRD